MRAITVHQPMAAAIIRYGKTTENRPALSGWRGLVGDTIAIHAARPAAWNDTYARDVHAITGRTIRQHDVDYSAIIGTARVVDLHWAQRDNEHGVCCPPWGLDGHAHLTLDLVRACTPIPCAGALGPWRVPDHALAALRGVRL